MPQSSKEARRAARRAAFGRMLVWGARAAAIAAVVLLIWGSLVVRWRVRNDPRFSLAGWKLSLGELPLWAPKELREELEGLEIGGEAEEPLTFFTPRVLSRVKAEILGSPWIRDVKDIRIYPPAIDDRRDAGGAISADGSPQGISEFAVGSGRSSGRIEVVLDLRIPIACVAAGGSFYLTDREGILLGKGLGADRMRELGLPAILGGEGRRARRPPPPGSVWEDRDVREGLEVACILFDERIAEEFPGIPVQEIDISNVKDHPRAGECEIVLRAGKLRLGWGRSPISPGACTLSVPEIVRNLRRVLRRPERFDQVELVLLYTDRLVGVRSAQKP